MDCSFLFAPPLSDHSFFFFFWLSLLLSLHCFSLCLSLVCFCPHSSFSLASLSDLVLCLSWPSSCIHISSTSFKGFSKMFVNFCIRHFTCPWQFLIIYDMLVVCFVGIICFNFLITVDPYQMYVRCHKWNWFLSIALTISSIRATRKAFLCTLFSAMDLLSTLIVISTVLPLTPTQVTRDMQAVNSLTWTDFFPPSFSFIPGKLTEHRGSFLGLTFITRFACTCTLLVPDWVLQSHRFLLLTVNKLW